VEGAQSSVLSPAKKKSDLVTMTGASNDGC